MPMCTILAQHRSSDVSPGTSKHEIITSGHMTTGVCSKDMFLLLSSIAFVTTQILDIRLLTLFSTIACMQIRGAFSEQSAP